VTERTVRTALGEYAALVIPSQSERVPLPHLLARRPTSGAGMLLPSSALGGVIRHKVPRDTDTPDDT
jgi:hypothetical protein